MDKIAQANAGFYRAFESLRLGEMERIWKHSDEVRCIHPGWGALSGWNLVRTSWERIFQGTPFMKFNISDVQISMRADVAWVVCVESIASGQLQRFSESTILATNIYEKCEGRWLMVHHHGSPVYAGSALEIPSKQSHLN